MNYVIYISDHLWNPITQIFNVSSIDINQKLNNLSTASFSLETGDKNCKYEYFKELNRIKICQIADNIEKVMFDWVVRWVSTDLNNTKITLNCRHFLLKKKILYIDKTYTNQSISSILQDIVDHINSRDTGFVNLVCDIDTLITRDYRKKKNFLDILKDLAWDTYEFIFENNTLTFTNTIWSDKSSWSEIVLFEFDINSPESRTITKAVNDRDADNIDTAVIWEDWNDESAEAISNFWRLEQGFNSWLASDLLNQRKDSTREVNIQPKVSDFFICDIWDIVKTYIYTWWDMMYYNWWLKVIEKTFKSWALNIINIKLNTWKVKTLDLIETISNLKSRVGNLEL